MMNCLSKEELFDFCNKELEESRMSEIKKHADNCEICQQSIDLINKNIALIKDSINFLNPDIRITKNSNFIKKEHKLNKVEYSRILSWAAGICLLVTLSILTTIKFIDNQKPVNDYEYFEYIPDLNDAWKENVITVTRYDKNGNPINHQIIGD